MSELLKLLRNDWLTLDEVSEELDRKRDTCSGWLKRLHANGLLDMDMNIRKSRFRRVRAYRVAQLWRSEQGNV